MNFFKLYIGDYLRDTGTLSVSEHGAYLLMLVNLYATEKPLPSGKELHRLLRAGSKAERDAVDCVVQKFWTETPEGLVNARAEREFGKAEHQRTVNRNVGKLGGRPKRKETESETESVSESEPNHNPNQTPDTRHQTNTPKPPRGAGGSVHEFPPGFERLWSAYPKKVGKDAAAKAFAKRRPDDGLIARMLAAVAKQAQSDQWRKDGGQFVPHLATWLNQGRWEDEIESGHQTSGAGSLWEGAL
jgi:uncharacterized protein YdaU (DUF1376 family)